MIKDTFGGSLKRERELRGVTLDEISAATRIATRFLQAIENERGDQLPGGAWLIAAVFVLALLAGSWFGTWRFLAWRTAKRTAEVAAVSAAPTPGFTSTQQQTAAEPAPANHVAPAPGGQDATSRV